MKSVTYYGFRIVTRAKGVRVMWNEVWPEVSAQNFPSMRKAKIEIAAFCGEGAAS